MESSLFQNGHLSRFYAVTYLFAIPLWSVVLNPLPPSYTGTKSACFSSEWKIKCRKHVQLCVLRRKPGGCFFCFFFVFFFLSFFHSFFHSFILIEHYNDSSQHSLLSNLSSLASLELRKFWCWDELMVTEFERVLASHVEGSQFETPAKSNERLTKLILVAS